MNKVDRYKILIRHMITVGLIASQKDLGAKMGYANETTISQIINGKVKEPKDFIERLMSFVPNLNREWLENGIGTMFTTDQSSGQQFNGPILGDNPQFSGRDTVNNPPCTFGADIDKIIEAINAQAKLTEEAHDIAKRAQDQIDRAQAQVDVAQQQMNRLLSMLEMKFNIQSI